MQPRMEGCSYPGQFVIADTKAKINLPTERPSSCSQAEAVIGDVHGRTRSRLEIIFGAVPAAYPVPLEDPDTYDFKALLSDNSLNCGT